MQAETWGNGAVQSVEFNSRVQPTAISLDKSGNLLQRYQYTYGQVNIDTGASDALNNGQVGRVDAFIGRDGGGNPLKAWEQRFAYDATGRLSRAREVRADTGASVWQQHFTYDRYGNRYQAPTGTPGNYNEGLGWFKVETGDINPATNRYTLPSITYNSAGQMTQNTYHRNSKYVYDANGRVRAWMRPDNTNLRTNVTDGTGGRVMVFNDTSWRHIIWDVFGRITGEYTSGIGLESENIYRGGGSAPLARRSTAGGVTAVKWEMTDVQGSVRLLTDGQGAATNRYDYTPFGETLGAGTGTRTTTQGYTGGQLRHRFAGMTHDYTATTLEDTPWRKMDSKAGRWTTPDPYLGSMTVSDPQSFNRYAYVGNDPVNFVDPSGLNGIQLENENVDVIASAYDPFDDPFFSGYGGGGAVVMPELPIIEVLTPIVVDPSAPEPEPQDKPQLERNLSHDTQNYDRWHRHFAACAREKGFQIAVDGALFMAGQPLLPKRFTTQATSAGKGASEGTSILSRVLGNGPKIPRVWAPTANNLKAATTHLGRAISRWTPYAAIAHLGVHHAEVVNCANERYGRGR